MRHPDSHPPLESADQAARQSLSGDGEKSVNSNCHFDVPEAEHLTITQVRILLGVTHRRMMHLLYISEDSGGRHGIPFHVDDTAGGWRILMRDVKKYLAEHPKACDRLKRGAR